MANRVAQVPPLPIKEAEGREAFPPQVQMIHVSDPAFLAGFQKAILDFELKYKHTQIVSDDRGITMSFIMATFDTDHSDVWKAGYQAGFFAALYNIVYSWRIHPTKAILRYRSVHRRRSA